MARTGGHHFGADRHGRSGWIPQSGWPRQEGPVHAAQSTPASPHRPVRTIQSAPPSPHRSGTVAQPSLRRRVRAGRIAQAGSCGRAPRRRAVPSPPPSPTDRAAMPSPALLPHAIAAALSTSPWSRTMSDDPFQLDRTDAAGRRLDPPIHREVERAACALLLFPEFVCRRPPCRRALSCVLLDGRDRRPCLGEATPSARALHRASAARRCG